MDFTSQLTGTELVRISLMLQEANAIASSLGRNVIFTRDEMYQMVAEDGNNTSDDQPITCIRLFNKETKCTTIWELLKFESQLLQMRELYHGEISESSGVTDIFNDSSDTWTKDLGLYTPGKTVTRIQRILVNKDLSVSPGDTLPNLPHTLPQSLASILAESSETLSATSHLQYNSDDQFERIITATQNPEHFEIIKETKQIETIEPLETNIQTYKTSPILNKRKQLSDQNVVTPSKQIKSSHDLFKDVRSVPELCLERVDKLISDMKRQRPITVLEKFLTHSECVLSSATNYVNTYDTSYLSSGLPLSESDSLRHASLNLSVSYEMVVSQGQICSQYLLNSEQHDKVSRHMNELGLNVKALLFSSQKGTQIDVKLCLNELKQSIHNIMNSLSYAVLTQLIKINTVNASKRARGSSYDNNRLSLDQNVKQFPDIELQAHHLFTHQGELSSEVCKGAVVLVKEVCFELKEKINNSYKEAQYIFRELSDTCLINPEILAGVCKVIQLLSDYSDSVIPLTTYLEENLHKVVELFKEAWSKVVGLLNTILNIGQGVNRLIINTKSAAEEHGDLDKIVSQTNVIAFHTISTTSAIEDLKQMGYELLPRNIKLEFSSKEVVRAAKTLNHLAKKCSDIPTTSLATGQSNSITSI